MPLLEEWLPQPFSFPNRRHSAGRKRYGRFFPALDRTIRKINPQMISAVIPKNIQREANTDRVSTAADVITRASDDQARRA